MDNEKLVIGDLGLARTVEESEAMTTDVGTLEYMAPELIKSWNIYNIKVDIW